MNIEELTFTQDQKHEIELGHRLGIEMSLPVEQYSSLMYTARWKHIYC